MRITCYSETFIVVNLLLDQDKNQQLFGSFALVAFLCLFIVLVTLSFLNSRARQSWVAVYGVQGLPCLVQIKLLCANFIAFSDKQSKL